MQLNIDQQKHKRMVRDVLMLFNGSAVHPAEMVLALGECVGRVVNQVDGSDAAKRQLVDMAIKQMAKAIDAGGSRIVVGG